MRDIAMLIMACKQLLELKTPFSVEYRVKLKGSNKDSAGYCSEIRRKGVLKKFRMVINCTGMIESDYDSFSVIAHEMVHAKMMEHEIHDCNYHHNTVFQDICRELEKELRKAKFPLTCPLYNPATDTT